MPEKEPNIVCRVKQYRRAKGWSQAQLARLVGVKRQAVYDIESGRYLPNTLVALRLAKHLGCRVEDLFSEETTSDRLPVTMAEGRHSEGSRVSLARVRGRVIGYPLAGVHSFGQELRPADGLLEKSGQDVRLLCSDRDMENTVLLLGCDPAFSLLATHVARRSPTARMNCRFASSHRALRALSAGQAHLAGTHLHSTARTDANVKLARKRLKGIGGLVVGFSLMEEGLMVAPGNPYGIGSATDLAAAGIRLVNREPGAALRVLLDHQLSRCGIQKTAVKGYDREVNTHNEGAQMVAYGAADAALGLRSIACAFGLDFVPMTEVRCDLVIPNDLLEHPTIKIALDVMQSRALRDEIDFLPGYSPAKTGSTIAEV